MTSEERCRAYRRRILDISQKVPALHIGGAFSCIEIVDSIYNELMHPWDVFIMSKGHAAIAQYAVLESQNRLFLNDYCNGSLGVHPDRNTPGIEVSTGSLGHGLGIAVGIALAQPDVKVYVLLSDGELQEGSTWEAAMVAANLECANLVVFVDNNDMQSATRASEVHSNLYPIEDKFEAFGWSVKPLTEKSPFPRAIVVKTIKGKGVSFMENDPKWHYRSPTPAEYELACKELAA